MGPYGARLGPYNWLQSDDNFRPGVCRDIHTRRIAKIVGVQRIYSLVGGVLRRPGPVDAGTKKSYLFG
jgi:hypothetical protein